MITTIIDKDDLYKLFPTSYDHYRTRGMANGVIIRLPKTYLKIYDLQSDGMIYECKLFKYGIDTPIRTDDVKYNDMKKYASMITFLDKNVI